MNKNLFFILACLFLTLTSIAQISKGSVLLGGDFRGYISEAKEGTNPTMREKGFVISPAFGKAIKENLILGAEATFGAPFFGDEPDGIDRKNRVYGLSVFLRKYKPVGKNGVYIFIQSKLGGLYTQFKQWGPGESTRGVFLREVALNIYPGVSFAISKRLQLESGFNNLINIYYRSNKTKLDGVVLNKTSFLELTSSLNNMRSSFYVGFRFLFSKSKA